MDLFDHSSLPAAATSPLSEVLRPTSLEGIVGQEKTIGPESRLGQLLRSGHIPSLILWGPPGSGKTTFALALANHSKAHFENLNATEAGAKALRQAGELGRERRLLQGQRTVLFVDEIHRFNRSQQDVLLPFIEKGDLILVGATTENPSYELNRALLSRSRVVVFERLQAASLAVLLRKAFDHAQLSPQDFLTPESQEWLISSADGDGRRLLNSLEVLFAFKGQVQAPLDPHRLRDLLQETPIAHDKTSEMHYDVISAFIKSIRGSDPDAALYYLARMAAGGEDPVFIARRLMVLASEDVGNADPRALSVAVAGLQAVEAIGMPEAGITLSQVTTYLASAPKSNRSYIGWQRAQELVRQTGSPQVPLDLRSAKTDLAQNLGYGRGYKYPHDEAKGWVAQSYLPDVVKPQGPLYEPSPRGFEKNIREYLAWMRGEVEKD